MAVCVPLILVSPAAIAAKADVTNLYTYKATIVSVHDGDTVRANIDLGFYTWIHDVNLRLFGIDTPEIRKYGKRAVLEDEKKRGIAARDFLRSLILGKKVIIKTIKDRKGRDKKGSLKRYLVIIYKDGVNINELLIKKGHAVDYMKKKSH